MVAATHLNRFRAPEQSDPLRKSKAACVLFPTARTPWKRIVSRNSGSYRVIAGWLAAIRRQPAPFCGDRRAGRWVTSRSRIWRIICRSVISSNRNTLRQDAQSRLLGGVKSASSRRNRPYEFCWANSPSRLCAARRSTFSKPSVNLL
jgi:hypothetical protein